jgi:microcystin-dependent protein
MTTISHKNLTGSQLHEPKGASTATLGTTYVSDGAGSGTWQSVGSTTGDLKPTIKTTADTGWVMLDDGTIGDSSSGASNRANADTVNLYTLLWNNISNTYAAVSSGRGANAAADFAAHKTIALPKALGRVLGSAGAGSGLTSRVLGYTTGEETHVLTTAELAAHTHDASGYTISPNQTITFLSTASTDANSPNVGRVISGTTASTSISGNSGSTGSDTAHNNMQPSLFVNWMIKL